jgi:hypothetical protein
VAEQVTITVEVGEGDMDQQWMFEQVTGMKEAVQVGEEINIRVEAEDETRMEQHLKLVMSK